jgi:hypothetical protein
MKKKLYLDDIRTPKTEGWDIVRSYDEFVNWITENGIPDEISFDHDLDKEHITGYDAAKWLGKYCIDNGLPLPEFNVHSANPVGKLNIESYLYNVKKHLDL